MRKVRSFHLIVVKKLISYLLIKFKYFRLLVVSMSEKKIIKKAFVNKRNKQLSITLSKKQMKKINPSIKFGENLFVELKVFNKKK